MSEASASAYQDPAVDNHSDDDFQVTVKMSSANAASSSIGQTAPRQNPNINRTCLYSFVDIFRSSEFKKDFDGRKFDGTAFCQWISEEGAKPNAPECIKTVYDLCEGKRTRHNEKVRKDRQNKDKISDNTETQETAKELRSVAEVMASQQIRQIVRVSLALNKYGSKDGVSSNFSIHVSVTES